MFLSKFASLPPRMRIGILAILLGVAAVFADSPYNKASVKVNLKDIALASVKDVNTVTIQELADWLIKGKVDFRLIDLRHEDKFNKYNIPMSENIAVGQLLESDLLRNEKILLYSDNDVASSQAWFILKAADFKAVSILDGGLENWKREVLFPICTCGIDPSKEQLHKHNKLKEVSKFFGGAMQNAISSKEKDGFSMPELKIPANVTLKKSSGKKKREGC